MTRLTTCFASAALLIVLVSTANAQIAVCGTFPPYPQNNRCVTPPRLGFNSSFIGGVMYVHYVNPGSTAQCMGLQPGDMIVGVNNRRIHSQFDYFQALRDAVDYHCGRVVLAVQNPYCRGPRIVRLVGRLNTGSGQSGPSFAAQRAFGRP